LRLSRTRHKPSGFGSPKQKSRLGRRLLGPGWLDARDEEGKRRLENPQDFVRIEIGTALRRGIPVIPILLEGTQIPKADQLPDDLRELTRRNGLNVRHVSFLDDLERLIRGLKRAQSLEHLEPTASSLVDKSPQQSAEEEAQRKAAEEAEARRKAEEERNRGQDGSEWTAVAESADRRAIKAFLERWPKGQHVEDAQAHIDALEREAVEAQQARITELRRDNGLRRGILLGVGAVGVVVLVWMALALLHVPLSSVPGPSPSQPTKPASGETLEATRRTQADAEAAQKRKAEAASEKAAAEKAAAEKAAAEKAAAEAEANKRRAEEAEEDAARRDPALSIQPGSGKTFRDRLVNGQPCFTCPEMVVVPAGRFTMGSPNSEPERNDGEDQVSVSIAKPFAVGKFAITRGEFAAFVKETGYKMDGGCDYEWNKSWRVPGFAQDDRHPVVCVTWNDAKAYAEWLSSKTGKTYQLLSEAEREYMARAGTTTPFWWGSTISTTQANFDRPRSGRRGGTVAVDSFKPNPWGLYNVYPDSARIRRPPLPNGANRILPNG
jgi:formylglycine-generating enzyme required for sulfatase activity